MLCINKPNRSFGKDTCYYVRQEHPDQPATTTISMLEDTPSSTLCTITGEKRGFATVSGGSKRRKTATCKSVTATGPVVFELPTSAPYTTRWEDTEMMTTMMPPLPSYAAASSFFFSEGHDVLYDFQCCDQFRHNVTLKSTVQDSMVRKEITREELEEVLYKIRNYEYVVDPANNFPLCGGLTHWNHRDGVVEVAGKCVYWRLYNTRGYDSRRGIPDSLYLSMVPFV